MHKKQQNEGLHCEKGKRTTDKLRQDNKIKAGFVKLRKTLNVAKKENQPRILAPQRALRE